MRVKRPKIFFLCDRKCSCGEFCRSQIWEGVPMDVICSDTSDSRHMHSTFPVKIFDSFSERGALFEMDPFKGRYYCDNSPYDIYVQIPRKHLFRAKYSKKFRIRKKYVNRLAKNIAKGGSGGR